MITVVNLDRKVFDPDFKPGGLCSQAWLDICFTFGVLAPPVDLNEIPTTISLDVGHIRKWSN